MNDPFGVYEVSKSLPYVKGKAGNEGIPITRMTAEQRSQLRSDVERVRRTRAERKIPTGSLKRPGNPSKRPPMTKGDWKLKSQTTRKVTREAAEAAKPVAQLGKTTFMPWTVKTNIGLAAAGTGAAGYALHRRHKVSKKQVPDEVIGGAAGLGATETAYVVGGQAAKHKIASYRKKNWDNKKHNPIWSEHRKKYGVEQMRGRIDNKKKIDFYRNYPKELPGGRATRALAFKNKNSTYIAALAAGTTAGAAYAHKTKVNKNVKDRETVAGAVVGGLAGQGAYQSLGYGPKRVIRSDTRVGYAHNKKPSEIKNPKVKARKKSWEKAKKTQHKKGYYQTSAKTKPEFWRTIPKDTYGSKLMRTTGWTHSGKTGVALGAASTVAGATLGAKYVKEKK